MTQKVDESPDREQSPVSSAETLPEKPVEAKPARSRRPFYIVGVILLIGLISGVSYWIYSRQFETTDDAYIEGDIVQISPKITAHITKIYVKENQAVKKGDLLVELDTGNLQSKLEQAQAQLKMAEAKREKAKANVALTKKTTNAGLNAASSNLSTARNKIEEAGLSADSKQNSIRQAQNQVHTAEAGLRQTQAQVPTAEANLAQIKAQFPAIQTKLELAQTNFRRYQKLHTQGDISQVLLDQAQEKLTDAEKEFETAKRQVDVAQAQLNAVRRQVEVAAAQIEEAKTNVTNAENDYRQSLSKVTTSASEADESAGRLEDAQSVPERVAVDASDISTADADVTQSQAAVHQAELELSYTKIYAPDDGFISRKVVQEGQLVQAEQILMAISHPGIWVVANFKETQVGKMRIGQAVDVYVDAFPGQVFHGKIESFQAGTGSRFSILPPENATGNFIKVVQRIPVKIVFDETPERIEPLVPGMSVTPKVRLR